MIGIMRVVSCTININSQKVFMTSAEASFGGCVEEMDEGCTRAHR